MLTDNHIFKSAIAFSGIFLMCLAITETVVDREGGRGVKNVVMDKSKSKKSGAFRFKS